MPTAIETMRKAFSLVSIGAADVPLRTAIEIPNHDAVTLFMPAYLHVGNRLGAKIISVFPHNHNLELPAIHAIVILINAATGQPEALVEGTVLTAIRTGAASGLATDLLARSDASTLAIIGSGMQARAQLEAVCSVRKIERVRMYSPTRAHAEQFTADMAGRDKIPAPIEIASSAHEAAAHADIICTATSSAQPVIGVDDVRPGTHINAIGSYTPSMREIDPLLVRQACLVVDQRQASLAEAGEVIACIEDGSLKADDLIELGEIVNGKQVSRTSADQITLFKSVGLAAQDVAAAQQALSVARRKRFGTVIEL